MCFLCLLGFGRMIWAFWTRTSDSTQDAAPLVKFWGLESSVQVNRCGKSWILCLLIRSWGFASSNKQHIPGLTWAVLMHDCSCKTPCVLYALTFPNDQPTSPQAAFNIRAPFANTHPINTLSKATEHMHGCWGKQQSMYERMRAPTGVHGSSNLEKTYKSIQLVYYLHNGCWFIH